MTNEELVADIQQGINVKDNMQQLYMQNKPLIAKFVKPYSEYAEYDDLMQEAYFGLQKAVEHYEPKEGAMFISYAMYWIKSAVSRYASDNGNTKRISNHMVQKIYRYRKFLGQYARVNQGFPTDDVICKELEINQRSLNSIRKTINEMNCISIDETVPGLMIFLLVKQSQMIPILKKILLKALQDKRLQSCFGIWWNNCRNVRKVF